MTSRGDYLLIGLTACLTVAAAWLAMHPFFSALQMNDALRPALTAALSGDEPPAVTVPPAPAERGVRMLAVGDMMFGRTVERLMKENGDEYLLARYGGRVGTLDHDIVFGNLEGPIPAEHRPTPNGSTRFSFLPSVAPWLADRGFTLVSLANNHTLDWAQSGYDNTVRVLNEAGIAHFGHYSNEAFDSYRFDKADTRLTFIGYNLIEPDFDRKAAVEWAKRVDAEREGDLVIASIHWGNEYVHQPVAHQRDFAEALVAAGVDLIIGQHPHVTQGIELVDGKPVFWSFGNFIFDQYFSQETQESFAADLAFGPTADLKEGETGTLAVTITPLAGERSQVFEMPPERATKWLAWLATISDPALATQIESGMLRLTIAP